MMLMTQTTINTVFLKLVCHVRIFWDFTPPVESESTQMSFFLRTLELKGMLDMKLVQVF